MQHMALSFLALLTGLLNFLTVASPICHFYKVAKNVLKQIHPKINAIKQRITYLQIMENVSEIEKLDEK